MEISGKRLLSRIVCAGYDMDPIPLITAVQLTLGSLHGVEPPQGHYCQTNPGVVVEHENYLAGAYFSSLCHPVEFIGYRRPITGTTDSGLGILGGLDHGYRVPILVALDYRWKHTDTYLEPEVINNRFRSVILGFSLRWEIK